VTATLLALYRRPDGGDDAIAAFERRYADEHMPLVHEVPGLRGTRVSRVQRALGGETDLYLIAALDFDDVDSLKAGLRSEPMSRAGAVLSEIARPMPTMLIVEDAPELA
jgi:uncharacterized protein (TIGR02118 family)